MADSVLRELGVSNGGRIVFDRSRVRILVCDPSTSPDVVDLLRGCSYQVIAVQNARQVMEVCRTGMAQVDLILAEVELPNKRGFKMLKYFMKEEHLKQIPIVMMSMRDEMAVVGKCLRLGAADYLVKPLRSNEMLNLWTHMWRRRRMLGLTEKHLISGSLNANDAPIDVLFGDTSESNTTSTDFFSEDSNGQARRDVMDGANIRLANSCDQARRDVMDGANSKLASTSNQSASSPGLELTLKPSSDLATAEENKTSGRLPSPPKKTELKIGEASAFLAYTKFCDRQSVQQMDKPSKLSNCNESHEYQSSVRTNGGSEMSTDWQFERPPKGSDTHDHSPMAQNHPAAVMGIPAVELRLDHSTSPWETGNTTVQGPNLNMFMGPKSIGSNHVPTGWSEQLRPRFPHGSVEQLHMFQMHVQNESVMGVPTIPPFAPSHHLPPNMLAANVHASGMLSPSLRLYCGLDGSMGLDSRIPPMQSLPPGHLSPPGFSYYPISLPVGQPAQLWSPMPSIPVSERTIERAERREAALSKFRQKRKDRCFEKKIRYVSRKRLAEQRPRNRGQFVRRSSGSEICGVGDETEDEYEEDESENLSVGGVGDRYPVNRVSVFVSHS